MMTAEINPSIAKHDLSHLLCSGNLHRASESQNGNIDALHGTIQDLFTPHVSFRRAKIESIDKGAVYLQEGVNLTSPKLARVLEPCKDIICFIATIGSGVEQEAARLTLDNHLSQGYIMDSIGSLLVENTVDNFQREIKKNLKAEGKRVTLRFSPGYCDWPITEQRKLFSLFEHTRIGVKLTSSLIMRPRKSISGVFGIVPSNTTSPPYNPCRDCKKKSCTMRRN